MNLRHFDLKEQLLLARRAESVCARSFRRLSERFQKADPGLSRRFKGIAEDEDHHLEELSKLDEEVPWPTTWSLDEPSIACVLGEAFPTLSAGPLPAEPGEAVRFAESVERESARFYVALKKASGDPGAVRVFGRIGRAEAGHLAELRR